MEKAMATRKLSRADIKLAKRIEKKVIAEILKLLDSKKVGSKPATKPVRTRKKSNAIGKSTKKIIRKTARKVVRKTTARRTKKSGRKS
jgi:hypothetical protein